MTVTAQHPRQYDPFAEIYSRHMAEDFARRVAPVLQLLLRELPAGALVLDLCCGAGQISRMLLDRGLRVVGLDASEPMLRLARKHAPQAKFFVADARRFALPPIFDVVVSSFNSLAHCTTGGELAQVFQCVRNALAPGKRFVFDLSMEEQYAANWRGWFALNGDDYACIVRPSYDADLRLGRNQITVFRRNDAAWQRSDFEVVQKCHSEDEVRDALRDGGFPHVNSMDAELDLGMSGERGRRFFVCSDAPFRGVV